MIEADFEILKAIHSVSPLLSPRPHKMGKVQKRRGLSLLTCRISASRPAASQAAEIHGSTSRDAAKFGVADEEVWLPHEDNGRPNPAA
jgi:hypothetical protein